MAYRGYVGLPDSGMCFLELKEKTWIYRTYYLYMYIYIYQVESVEALSARGFMRFNPKSHQ